MTRLNLALLLAVIASALWVVHSQYASRQLFTELHRAQLEARRLETEFDRLQVDKRGQATPLRIERLAKDQLRMRTATPAITQYVRPDGSVIPAVVEPPASATDGAAAHAAQPAAHGAHAASARSAR